MNIEPTNLEPWLTNKFLFTVVSAVIATLIAALIIWLVRKIVAAPVAEGKRFRHRLQEHRFERRYLQSLVGRERFVTIPGQLGQTEDDLDLRSIYVPLKLATAESTAQIKDDYLACMPPECDRQSVDQVIKEFNRIVILGQPGSGKSILLSFLALQYVQCWRLSGRIASKLKRLFNRKGFGQAATIPAPHERRFPILIPLRKLNDERNLSLTSEHLASLTAEGDLRVTCPKDFFSRKLRAGRCIVLMDGLDEIPKPRQARVAEQIRNLATDADYHRNLFVLTSRLKPYEKVQGFRVQNICGFNSNDIVDFAHKWYSECIPPRRQRLRNNAAAPRDIEGQVQSFVTAIHQSDNACKLAENPLLLSMLAAVHQPGSNLPTRRAKFYEVCLPSLLSERHRHGRPPVRFNSTIKEQILKPVAYWLHSKRMLEAKDKDIRGQILKCLPEVGRRREPGEIDEFLKETAGRNNVLASVGNGKYRFTHRTFQEYLAAKHLVDRGDAGRYEIEKHLHDPWWEEVVLFYVGSVGTEEAEDFIEMLLKGRKDPLRQKLFLATRCTAELIKIKTPIQDQLMEELKRTFSDGPYEGLRQETLQALLYLGQGHWAQPVQETLMSLLKSSDAPVRHRSALALVRLEKSVRADKLPREVIEAMVDMLCHERLAVRLEAHYALGGLDYATSLTQGLLALTHSPITKLRGGTALALGILGKTGDDPLQALVRLLNDGKPEVRRRAAAALGWLGAAHEQEVIDGLVKNVKHNSEMVRGISASALGELGVGDHAVIKSLIGTLSDPVAEVAGRAASALGWLGYADDDALTGLTNCLHGKAETRARAASALGELGRADDRIVQDLLGLLSKDPDPNVKGCAAASLGWLRVSKRPVIESLLTAMGQEDRTVTKNVTYALAWLERSNVEVHSIIVELLNSDDTRMRANACSAIGRLGLADGRVMDELLRKIELDKGGDPNERVRMAATSAIRRLGQTDPKVTTTLVRTLGMDPSTEVRWRAALALGSLEQLTPDVTEALVERLQRDPDKEVILRCADALARMGHRDTQAAGVLIKLVRDEDPEIAKRAAAALSWLGEATTVVLDALVTTLSASKEGQVRSGCALALGRLGRAAPHVIESLVDRVSDPSSEVRARSAAALARLAQIDASVPSRVADLLEERDTRRRTNAIMALYVLARALDQGLRRWIPKKKLGILSSLLGDMTPVGHPIVGNESTVQDIAWWLLQEYNRAYPIEYKKLFVL